MAPFRWPLVQNDIDLAIEVDAARPEKSSDWDLIAAKLNNHFSTPEKPVELTGRSCRERMDRVLEKYKSEESRSLKRYLHILIIYREALSFQLNECFNILGREPRTSSPNWNSFAKI